MADVITRLKLESGEFDSKIKRATQGLLQMEQDFRKVGGTLGILEQDQKKFVQSLGQMQTVSTTVRGKIGELSSAYTELSVQYKRLTDEEKQGDYGRALTASLEQLKSRIAESKAQLAEVNSELGNTSRTGGETGGVLDQLAGKFSQNIAKLTSLGAALAAGKAALDVAKDAFFASEASVDEWGRTMDSSRSLYEGFLTALNTGDISGYLSNMGAIAQAARDAYNELDRLGTMGRIQAPQISNQQTENDRLRTMLMTGHYIPSLTGGVDVFNGKRLQAGQTLPPEFLRRIEGQLTAGVDKVVGLVSNEVKQTGKAIEAVYTRQSKELGMSLSEFKKGTSSMAEFDKRLAGYDKYQKWQADAQAEMARQGGRGYVSDRNNPYRQYKTWGVFRVDGDRYNEITELIARRNQQAAQAYGMQGQAYRTINRINGVTPRGLLSGGGVAGGAGGAGGGGGTSVVKTEEQLNDEKIRSLTAEYVRATDERRTAIQSEIKGLKDRNAEIQRLKDEAQGKIKVFEPGTMEFYQDALKTLQKELLTLREKGADPIEIDFKTNEIKDVQKEIDRLNGKVTVEVELKRPPSLEEQIRTELAASIEKADYTMMANLMREQIKYGLESVDFTPLQEALAEGMNIPDETWQAIIDRFNEQLKDKGIALSADFDSGSLKEGAQGGEDTLKNMDKLFNGLSSVANGLQQMGVKLPEGVKNVMGVVQGLMTTINAVNSIISLFSTSTATAQVAATTGNTIALGALTAAVAANTTALSVNSAFSLIPFKGGGIVPHAASGYMVPGNDYSDRTPVLVSSGELILNRAQQGNLAEQLSGGGLGNMQLEARVSAEDLIFVLNNNGLRRGYGKFIHD